MVRPLIFFSATHPVESYVRIMTKLKDIVLYLPKYTCPDIPNHYYSNKLQDAVFQFHFLPYVVFGTNLDAETNTSAFNKISGV